MRPLLLALLLAVPAAAQAPVVMKNPPKMTCTVAVKEVEVKDQKGKVAYKVIGSGEAAYPDGVALQFGLHLKEDTNFIYRNQGYVTAGKWEIDLPDLGARVYHGVYTFVIEFDPGLQEGGAVNKLPADKRGMNHATCDQKIGTDEMIAEETAAVLSYYKDAVAKFRAIYGEVKTEYDAQQKNRNQAAWQKVKSSAEDRLLDLDSAVAAFRKQKLNIMRVDLCDSLGGSILQLKDMALQEYTRMLGFEGRPPKESSVAQYEETFNAMFAKLDKETAGVKAPEPKK